MFIEALVFVNLPLQLIQPLRITSGGAKTWLLTVQVAGSDARENGLRPGVEALASGGGLPAQRHYADLMLALAMHGPRA